MKKKILVVDDTAENVDILVELLSKKYDVMATLESTMAIEMVKENKPDLILLDIMMPEIDGYEVCRRLKLDKKTKKIPIIFITAKADEESIEKAFDAGGSDYVTKPFKPKELLARVSKELKAQKLINQLEASKKELELLSSTDYMTKLYNRRYFIETANSCFDLAKRNSTPLSLVMLDIDNFKQINDTYGHKVGDDVIITLASIMIDVTRKSDIVCRWGGEEFLILFPQTSIEGTLEISNKIRQSVEAFALRVSKRKKIYFTISLGVCGVDFNWDRDIESCISKADDALYAAKRNGKNCVISCKDSNLTCQLDNH
ncbi:diguanylate cyclase [Sulfurimonas aquatica]|uniref:diguanylate cyclase n=1 Tax=Sulfurimonas aquatica TaxID=2672570 RepID=A0A975GCG5_9BACT|nr:diguanylate cyclase [Sulfurimonas aquatica]QSZ41600.1 diguanylate cyclase [Sulfurimonas aquatica]